MVLFKQAFCSVDGIAEFLTQLIHENLESNKSAQIVFILPHPNALRQPPEEKIIIVWKEAPL